MMVNLTDLLPPQYAMLYHFTDQVVDAAVLVADSAQGGGYTPGLSMNLRRLEVAVREWRAHLALLRLDSDVNGFDRSEGYSNGQTEVGDSGGEGGQRAQAQAERGAGGDASGERKPPHRAPFSASVQARREGDS